MGTRRDEGPGAGLVDEWAVVVPLTAYNLGGDPTRAPAGEGQSHAGFSPGSRTTTKVRLALVSDGPRAVVEGRSQEVTAAVPNWLRVILCYSGSNQGPNAELPAQVQVCVRVDPATRRIVALDVERAEADLGAYRPIATRWWKQDEGPFAGVRSMIAAPGATVRGIRGLASAWRTEASRFSTEARNPDAPPLQSHTDAEVDQIGRTADTIAHRLASDPSKLTPVRASALEAGPMMVENVRSGSMAMADLETWLVFQERSGGLTPEEVASFRAAATGA